MPEFVSLGALSFHQGGGQTAHAAGFARADSDPDLATDLDADVDYVARALAGLTEDLDMLRGSELSAITPEEWQAAARQLGDWLAVANEIPCASR